MFRLWNTFLSWRTIYGIVQPLNRLLDPRNALFFFYVLLSRCIFDFAGEMVVTNEKYETKTEVRSQFETKMTLKVKNFQAQDTGSYKCNAKNSVGDVESSIRLYGKSICYLFLRQCADLCNIYGILYFNWRFRESIHLIYSRLYLLKCSFLGLDFLSA